MSTSKFRTIVPEVLAEKTSWQYAGTFTKENGQAVTPAEFTALTLKIYVEDDTRTDIQASVGILNADRGSVTSGGTLTIDFKPSDSAIVTTGLEEVHVALIEASWDGGIRQLAHEVAWTVRNLEKRT